MKTLISRTAFLAFAAIVTITAMLSRPAKAETFSASQQTVLAMCDGIPSCKVSIHDDGSFFVNSKHLSAQCPAGSGACTGQTFMLHNPKHGITLPTRPVVNVVSAGGNQSNHNPAGIIHPKLQPIVVKTLVSITKPVTPTLAIPAHVNINVAAVLTHHR